MRKIKLVIISFILAISSSVIFAAQETRIAINYETLRFSPSSMMVDGVVLVPTEAIDVLTRRIGGGWRFDESTQTITVSHNNTGVKLRINDSRMTIVNLITDRENVSYLAVPARMSGGIPFVPIEAIMTALGFKVNRDRTENALNITTQDTQQGTSVGDFEDADSFKYDFFFGYSLMRIDEYDHMNVIKDDFWYQGVNNSSISPFLKKGFSTAFTYNFISGRHASLGLETSFRFNTDYILSASEKVYDKKYTDGLKRTDIAFFVGPRFTFLNSGRATPFIHGLAGIIHERLSYAEDVDYREKYSERLVGNSFYGVAAGGGLDIKINKNWAFRAVQVDYYLSDRFAQPLFLDSEKKRFKDINISFGFVARGGK